MVYVVSSMTLIDSIRGWPLLFAQETDKDLDFDDELEEDEGSGNKPPTRRPILIILALLAVIGVGYLAMEPDILSTIKNLVTAPASNTQVGPMASLPGNKSREAEPSSSSSPPIPRFQEGQLVTFVAKPGNPPSMMLDGEAMGNSPGPSIRSGELLTVLDGTLVENTWRYLVHTKSGGSGWIDELQLETQS
ncbi:MAG: hypothetical protein O6840_06115 [Nitrospirae bacterium]|nr:hypothetical protein [Nitrospirota bacterium]